MARIAVIGIGNVLTGDDAIGPHVLKVLEASYVLPPEEVFVLDAGTPGYDLTSFLADAEAVILIDSVKAKGGPGEVLVYDKKALLKKAPVLAMSPHEPGVREALMNADFMGVAPKIVRLVGVIPGSVETGIGITPEVRAAVPAAVAQVVKELLALGLRVAPRVPPLEPDLWWEKQSSR
jgi:hydrogenase maturation protease